MTKKPIAVVLGGTLPHIALIRNLQRRGYLAVLVDYYKNPPARNAADEHIQESTLDQEKVLQIARSLDASLVISTCIDQANVTACYVAQELGLPAPYSYETALDVTNKIRMKTKMLEAGIPTARHWRCQGIKDCINSELTFPVVVKPADSNSSKGVRKASNLSELDEFLSRALSISRTSKAIIEEFKDGVEIGVDCYVKDGQATIIMKKRRRRITMGDDPIQQIYGCIWPTSVSRQTHAALQKAANSITRVFHLENTPLMIQAIVSSDGISVLEFAPRIGGGESFRIIKLSTGFDIIHAAVDSFLGIQVHLNHRAPQGYYAENFIYARSSLFGRVSEFESLLARGIIEYLDCYKTRGAEIGPDISSNNRVGVFTVKADHRHELFGKIDTALRSIEVYDTHGKPIMRRDIYPQLRG